MLKPNMTEWVGNTRTQSGCLSDEIAGMLHAILKPADMPPAAAGSLAPYLWHWCAFNAKAPMERLATDGHPQRGGFLPPVNLPRRMWAGGSLTFHAPLHLGAPLEQVSTITAVEEKSDVMTFVTVSHDTYEDGVHAVSETQNIVYLEIPEVFSPPKARPTPTAPSFAHQVPVSEPLLFRYSAATFNAHRIHYDLKYTQEVEKYPALVVHGPLQATLLLDAAVNHTGKTPATFAYRGVHPIFHTDDLHLFGFDETPDTMALCTGIPGKHQGMAATVTWRTA